MDTVSMDGNFVKIVYVSFLKRGLLEKEKIYRKGGEPKCANTFERFQG